MIIRAIFVSKMIDRNHCVP